MMRYFYNFVFDEFMRCPKDEVGKHVRECINNGEIIEISKDVYDNMYLFWETREKIHTHVATYHADWGVCITADGQHFGLTLEGEFLCGMDLEDVIPALDYLYSAIDATSTVEDDVQALDRMIDTWGL